MNLRENVKRTLSIINKALKQVPNDKRILLTSRINEVLHKYKHLIEKDGEEVQTFQKQLQFNLNFIKLSHPNLDYTIQKQKKQEEGQEKQEHKVDLMNEDFLQFQRLSNDIFDTVEERQQQAREQVQFSNWFDGNADPEMLKRHKELLERQNFSGQFWQEKKKPTSPTKQYLKSVLSSGQPIQIPKKEVNLKNAKPQKIQGKDQVWEKIKK